MKHPLFSAFVLLLFTAFAPVPADEDPRMRQDLTIMEDVLRRLIADAAKPQSQDGQTVLFRGDAVSVRGSYLPGYGVLFQVSPGTAFRAARVAYTQGQGGRVAYTTDSEPADAGRARVEAAIRNFLGSYADIIANVPDTERIAVAYAGSEGQRFLMSTTKRSVSDFRAGRLNETRFQATISMENEPSAADLDIFKGILQSALAANDSTMGVGRAIHYVRLPGYGLLVSAETRNRGGHVAVFGEGMGNFEFELPSLDELEDVIVNVPIPEIDIRIDSVRVGLAPAEVEEMRRELRESMAEVRVELDRAREERARTIERRRQTREQVVARHAAFVTRAKETLLDYGRTLSSLREGETLIFRVRTGNPGGPIPAYTTFQVSQSVLRDYDRRSVSRDAALGRIRVDTEP